MAKQYLATREWVEEKVSGLATNEYVDRKVAEAAGSGLPSFSVWDTIVALTGGTVTIDEKLKRLSVSKQSSSSVSVVGYAGPISFADWLDKGYRALKINVSGGVQTAQASAYLYLSANTTAAGAVAAYSHNAGEVEIELKNFTGTYYFVLLAGGSSGNGASLAVGGWTIAP